MDTYQEQHRAILQRIAYRAMLERDLLPDFSSAALAELNSIQKKTDKRAAVRDLQNLLWCSIDNDESRDLDQLTVAEKMPDGNVKVLVAVADVASFVKAGSAIDAHALHNTTSVYTAARIFPMLPEQLSTDLTSLNFNKERLAFVVEMLVQKDGSLLELDIYRARVRNHAKLAYNSVAAWLDGNIDIPESVSAVAGLEENLRMQDQIALSMKKLRHSYGALSLETIEARPVFEGDQIRALAVEEKNRAKAIIEDFMIAANGVTARFLASHEYPSLRRVVRTPKRWERIVEIASEHHYRLPAAPDSRALEKFLNGEKTTDPIRFPDLSLAVIKLMGAGEYVAELPHAEASGHFGLAVKDYSHSTAPNRRYPDLLTQRLLAAALEGRASPYRVDELEVLARHCTDAEDAANKVERQVAKSAAALLLQSRIGEQFNAIVTGASEKGTWVRLLHVPVEGKLVSGFEGLDVGMKIRVQLVLVNVDQGFIDFKAVERASLLQENPRFISNPREDLDAAQNVP